MKKGISTQQLAFLAFAAVINIIGGYIALFLHLPIYLDSIGTILISAVLGPIYGMAPSLLSNLVLGMMGDVYAFYYLPVGMLLGALNGWLWNKPTLKIGGRLLLALIITLPTSLLSACITAKLFGGITSSGSTVLVQLLAKTPLGLTMSCFLVQLLTDCIDRFLSIALVQTILKKLPQKMHKLF